MPTAASIAGVDLKLEAVVIPVSDARDRRFSRASNLSVSYHRDGTIE